MKLMRYRLMQEINMGTEEEPEMVQTFYGKEVQTTDANFDTNYAIALSEAYNGEVEVEDLGPDPETPEGDVEARVSALETAIAEGLNLYEGDLGNG